MGQARQKGTRAQRKQAAEAQHQADSEAVERCGALAQCIAAGDDAFTSDIVVRSVLCAGFLVAGIRDGTPHTVTDLLQLMLLADAESPPPGGLAQYMLWTILVLSNWSRRELAYGPHGAALADTFAGLPSTPPVEVLTEVPGDFQAAVTALVATGLGVLDAVA